NQVSFKRQVFFIERGLLQFSHLFHHLGSSISGRPWLQKRTGKKKKFSPAIYHLHSSTREI
ncbi:MAG: hypothetical protein WAQ10_04775, partial [Dethiobacteria bacterium]